MTTGVSIAVITYGRTACLRELLECFCRREFSGSCEMVILNDVKEQTLATDVPGVRIINEQIRYPSIGAKRSAAVRVARHSHVAIVDDDDLFLPGYLQGLMLSASAWQRPIWPTAHFLAEGRGDRIKMRLVNRSIPGTFLMAKDDFDAIGGYPPVDVIEDQGIRAKAFERFDCEPERNPFPPPPGFIYRWANDVYHISGSLEYHTVLDRSNADLQSRLRSGAEPSGTVRIDPHWEADYIALAEKASSQGIIP